MNREVGITERDLFTVGEMAGVDAELVRSYTAESARELGMVITFEHVQVDQASAVKWDLAELKLSKLKSVLASYQYALAEEGWNALYLGNHDQPRSVSRFGDDSEQFRQASAKTLATTLHLLKGTPFLYQGDEIGMTNAGFTSIDQYDDVESVHFYEQALTMGLPEAAVLFAIGVKSRDNARTPMCWDASPGAGFTTGKPWLQINANHDRINVVEAMSDPNSVLQHYRRLISMRHELAVVRDGVFELLLADDEELFCFTRTLGSERLLVMANWSTGSVPWPHGVPDISGARLLLGTHPDPGDVLAGWESRVYALPVE